MHIVIEGQDCTGKNTEAELLADYFRSQGEEVICYSESGSDSQDDFVKTIATLTYGSRQNLDKKTRVLLFLINRYEQWRRLAMPILERGGIVITTRSWLSTLIYEGHMEGADENFIKKAHELVLPESYFHPDKIVCLILDDEERTRRLQLQEKRFDSKEYFKSKDKDYQDKLNQTYIDVAKQFSVPTLDASGTKEEVLEKLKKLFQI